MMLVNKTVALLQVAHCCVCVEIFLMMLVNKTFVLLHVFHCCVCGDISDDVC